MPFLCFIFELKAKKSCVQKFTIGKKSICMFHVYFFAMFVPLLFDEFTPYA